MRAVRGLSANSGLSADTAQSAHSADTTDTANTAPLFASNVKLFVFLSKVNLF